MKVVWINGWGLGVRYLEMIAENLYPNKKHEYILPKKDWDIELEHQSRESTIIAYSLGAFLLLNRPDLSKRFERVIFMAPFEDIKKESEKGGRVHFTQLVYLRRWLLRDNVAAIKDFIVRAGLKNYSSNLSGLLEDDLVWGIDRLINTSVERGSLNNVEAWIGGNDRLLDAGKICELYPSVTNIPNADHDLKTLLAGASIEL